MLFNSVDFVFFLAAVLGFYYWLGHRAQNRLLLAASYLFYGWWDWRFCSLLAISTVVDFFCARWIASTDVQTRRRRLLGVSLFTNLGILGFFKYFDFFSESARALLESLGFHVSTPTLQVILPSESASTRCRPCRTRSTCTGAVRRPRAISSTSPSMCRSFLSWSPARSSGRGRCCRSSSADGRFGPAI